MFFFVGCDKHRAKKYAGDYDCEVNHTSYSIAPSYFDTSYKELIHITRTGKYLNILDYQVHIDSLWKDKQYQEGYVHRYFRVQFIDDSVYILISGGGLGGGYSYSYKGLKKN